MEEKVLNLKGMINTIVKKYKVILGITILCGLAGYYITTTLKPVYEASLKVFVGKDGLEGSYTTEELTKYKDNIGLYTEVIRTDDFFKGAIEDAKVSRDINIVSSNVSIAAFGENAPILQIIYRDIDKGVAVKLLESITNKFIETNTRFIVDTDMEVIESPKVRTNTPNKIKIITVSVLGGLILSIGLILIWDYLDDTVKSIEEMENLLGISVIGSIPESEDMK